MTEVNVGFIWHCCKGEAFGCVRAFIMTLRGVRVLNWNVTSSSYQRIFPLTTLSVFSQHDSGQRLEGNVIAQVYFAFNCCFVSILVEGFSFIYLRRMLPKKSFPPASLTVNAPRSLKLTWISSGCVVITENPTRRERGIGVKAPSLIAVHSCHLADFTWCPLMPLHAEFALYNLFLLYHYFCFTIWTAGSHGCKEEIMVQKQKPAGCVSALLHPTPNHGCERTPGQHVSR